MKIHFTRHGESLANTLHIISNRDLPHALTETGRAQAQALATRLKDFPLLRIYASPVLRARQTAEIVGAALQVPVEVAEGLKEYDCGVLEGRGDEAAWAQHAQFWQDWLAGRNRASAPEGGESFFDIQRRVREFVSGLIAQYNGTPAEVLCVSHGGTLTFGLPGVLSNLETASLHPNRFPHTVLVSAEWEGEQLVCTRWDETQPGGAKP